MVEQHDPEVAPRTPAPRSRHMFWSQPKPWANIIAVSPAPQVDVVALQG